MIRVEMFTPEQQSEFSKRRWSKPDAKEAAAEKTRQRWADPEYKARVASAISQTQKGRTLSDSHIASLKSTWQRPEVRERHKVGRAAGTPAQAAAMAEHWANPEYRLRVGAAISAGSKGKSKSEANRAAIRASWERAEVRERHIAPLLGRSLSLEHRQKISESWDAQPNRSEERRRKISAAHQARYPQGERVGRTVRAREREAVLARDGNICGICSDVIDLALRPPHPASLNIDHMIPRAHGGTNDLANLQPAHRICNVKKGVRPRCAS